MSDSNITVALEEATAALSLITDVGNRLASLLEQDPKFGWDVQEPLANALAQTHTASQRFSMALLSIGRADRIENHGVA